MTCLVCINVHCSSAPVRKVSYSYQISIQSLPMMTSAKLQVYWQGILLLFIYCSLTEGIIIMENDKHYRYVN